jgi:hypothetical protein
MIQRSAKTRWATNRSTRVGRYRVATGYSLPHSYFQLGLKSLEFASIDVGDYRRDVVVLAHRAQSSTRDSFLI